MWGAHCTARLCNGRRVCTTTDIHPKPVEIVFTVHEIFAHGPSALAGAQQGEALPKCDSKRGALHHISRRMRAAAGVETCADRRDTGGSKSAYCRALSLFKWMTDGRAWRPIEMQQRGCWERNAIPCARGRILRQRLHAQVGGGERRYHVVITAQGSAVHWQARVHYYWYKKTRQQCEDEKGVDCQMGGFTRILHSGQPDELMDEIPTHVVEPLQDKDNQG